MQSAYALLALAAAASAVVLPALIPREGGYRLEVETRDTVHNELAKRGQGNVSVIALGGWWATEGTAGGQQVEMVLDTGSADL